MAEAVLIDTWGGWRLGIVENRVTKRSRHFINTSERKVLGCIRLTMFSTRS